MRACSCRETYAVGIPEEIRRQYERDKENDVLHPRAPSTILLILSQLFLLFERTSFPAFMCTTLVLVAGPSFEVSCRA